jgi:hypothetical protein
MSWLTPLGFLGLIGLLALLIIYIIKPNYQNKFLSSTFIWKLSLKYRKKKMPLNKLRNILLIICQVLIVVACALILAQPYIKGEDVAMKKERVIVIDASVNMLAEVENETRFERAVSEAEKLSRETLDEGGRVSVILAGREASFVVQRAESVSADEISRSISSLASPDDFKCTWGNGDIGGAMELANKILEDNAYAEVILLSGTKYIDDGKVNVVDVSDEFEWNVSILDVRALIDENYYRFEVDVASYARSESVKICVEVQGAYGDYGTGSSSETFSNGTVKLEYSPLLEDGKTTTVTFGSREENNVTDLRISSYDHVYCYISADDSLDIDNSFHLYGGTAQPLKIQYYSTKSNNFVNGTLLALRNQLKGDWDIQLEVLKDSEEMIAAGQGMTPATEGFDIYIYEHRMPNELPTDGVVILIDPDKLPKGADFVLGERKGIKTSTGDLAKLDQGSAHPIMNNINAQNIGISRYRKINSYDGVYTPLMYIEDTPVAIAKNEPDSKVVVLTLDLHYSDFAVTPEFPMFMKNIIDYYLPTTFENDVVEIYDKVTLNSRSEKLSVDFPGNVENPVFTEFPSVIEASVPGIYTVVQTPISGRQIVENFYVIIPVEQCNITREVDFLENPYYPPIEEAEDIDYVFYFALALVCLAFAEWWLKSREYKEGGKRK